jgi:lipopolysaccharide export system protein LptC
MTLLHRARYWLPLLPLLGILGATYWLDQQVQTETDKPDSVKRHEPDGVMENFSAVTFSEQGIPRSVMTGKQLVHYPDDDSTTVEEPDITSLHTEHPSSNHPAVHSTARHGIITSKGDEVFLEHGVKVLREADAKQGELVIHTEYLHIIPGKDLIKTDRAVKLMSDHDTVYAVGLEMDNQARTLKLLSQVKAEHAVPDK